VKLLKQDGLNESTPIGGDERISSECVPVWRFSADVVARRNTVGAGTVKKILSDQVVTNDNGLDVEEERWCRGRLAAR